MQVDIGYLVIMKCMLLEVTGPVMMLVSKR
jgi:hypothetical protein